MTLKFNAASPELVHVLVHVPKRTSLPFVSTSAACEWAETRQLWGILVRTMGAGSALCTVQGSVDDVTCSKCLELLAEAVEQLLAGDAHG